MRTLKSLAPWAPLAVLWMIFLAQFLSALFAERVLYFSRGTPMHWVTYRDEPTLFVLILATSVAGTGFLGWLLLGVIPRKD